MDKNTKMNGAVARQWGICSCLSAVLSGLLILTGCSEDSTLLPDNPSPTGGQVVVDYAVGERQTRSVSHEALPAHERIKSLVYLLYDEEGELVKQREIPGISSMNDGDWPMKRATMTWDQREALKDTLEQGRNYTAVFVANTDPSLFGGEEVLHLKETQDGEETYVALDKVYLSLPTTTAFGDNNMFYLSVCEIQPTADNDRDNHYDCPVTLQRIVSRTDFFSDDYQAWDTDFTREKIRTFTDGKVYDVLTTIDAEYKTRLGISSWLEGFISAFSSFATSKGYWVTDTNLASWYGELKDAVNGLDCSPYITDMPDADKEAIQIKLYDSCLENATLKGLWQPWTGLQAKVVYSSRADRFYVSGKAAKVGDDGTATEALSPFLDMIQQTTTTAVMQNTFTLIGFGENAGTAAGSELNKMTELRLYESADAASPVTVIPLSTDVQSFADQGGNERVQLVYCPIKTLAYNTGTTGLTYNLTVDIKSAVTSAMDDDYNTCSDKLDAFFADDAGTKYGTGLDGFILKITLPDLSQSGALTVTSEWSEK